MESQEESGEGFTVRDRRRTATDFDSDASAAPVAEAAAEAEPVAAAADPDTGPTADTAEQDEDDEARSLPDIHLLLQMFLMQMRELAWLRMGLMPNPGSGQFERDMAQAKVAIDTAAFVAKQLEPAFPAEERLPLRALISDLQMNFVEQSKKD